MGLLGAILLELPAIGQQHPGVPGPRVLARVNDGNRTTLPHSRPASVASAIVGSRLPTSTPLRDMVLVLQPSAAQEAALRALLDRQQDRASPDYHQWLTPETFAHRYGVDLQDVTSVSAWLQAGGLTVQGTSRSGRFVTFSGSAGAVEHVFRTELHQVTRAGEAHIANTVDLSIPAALAPVVRGLARLDDLYHRDAMRPNAIPGGTIHLRDASLQPQFGSNATGVHQVSPGDAAVIYNALPLTRAGIDGTGTTIAVIGRSNVNPATVADFRSIFGLSANALAVTVVGTDPGISDDAEEAYLDIEWAGALATGSTVRLLTSAPSLTSSGIDTASLYAVDNNIGDILSLSYGECESDATAAGTAFWNSLWQQAAAQGQTVFVSAGDSGAAGCNASTDSYADAGFGVNALGSSAYNVAVGGTMFVDYGPAQYWGATRTTPYTSALGYIPEAAWNEGRLSTTELNGTSTALFSSTGITATGGGVSIDTARPAWQTGSQINPQFDPAGTASGSTITGLHRLVPDVAMAASFGHDGSLYCGTGMCVGGNLRIGVIGGTSLATPLMASAQALVNARNGGRQGNANIVYYALAAKQAAAGLNCQASIGSISSIAVTLPDATCDFHDVVAGGNTVPTNASGSLGMGFAAVAGFDEATGLGSVNIANLANDWAASSLRAATATLTLAPATGIAHGTAQAFTIAVSPGSGGTGTPTGAVTLVTDAGASVALPQPAELSTRTLTGSLTTLPAGDYTVHAHYGGDGTFAPADSPAITVSIAREPGSISLAPVADFSYGSSTLTLRSTVVAHSGSVIPSGSVTYTVQGLASPIVALDASGQATLLSGPGSGANYAALMPGTYGVTASYSGDDNVLPASTTGTITVTRALPTVQLTTAAAIITAGASVTLQFSATPPAGATTPTGMVQFTDGTTGATLCTSALTSGVATCTTTALTLTGVHAITANYAGDALFRATSASLQINVQPPAATIALPAMSAVYGATILVVPVTITPGQAGTLTVVADGATPVATQCVAATGTCIAQLSTAGLGVGTHALKATFTMQAGVTASSVNTLTITPATALITLLGLDATYDGTLHPVIASTTPAGLRIALTYAGQASAPSAAGSYPVVATVQDSNYTGSATATLHVASAAPVLAFTVPPHQFGDAPFALTATSASSAPVNFAVVSGPATLSGTVLTLNGAGTVVITASQPVQGNYGAASAQTSFNVAPGTTILALTTSSNPAVVGTPATFVAAVSVAAGVGAVSAGTVAFSSDNVPLGSTALQNGQASLTFTLPGGTHAIVATYTGSANLASSAAMLSFTVTAPPTFTLATPSTPAVALATGGWAMLPVTVTAGAGYTGSVTLGCADLPATITCTFIPAAIVFHGNTAPQTVAVQFNAAAQHSFVAPGDRGFDVPLRLALIFGLPGLLGSGFAGRKFAGPLRGISLCAGLLCATAMLLCGAALTGCATPNGAATTQHPAAGTYTVHVVATGVASVQSVPVTLTVQ